MSEEFSLETCSHFIHAISYVSGSSVNAFQLFTMIEKLYDKVIDLKY